MFQQFFEDTLMSRYIKGMLSYTKIPLLTSVEPGDIILSGCQYLWDEWIIKCVTSGKFSIEGVSSGDLYPGRTIYPSIALFPGSGEALATFTILDRYFEKESQSTYTYRSNCNYYDPDTHYHLGNYLRYLKINKGIDLMPYYNCYNYKIVDDVCLTSPSQNSKCYELRSDSRYKIMAVPINFGKVYTIAIESTSTIRCRCVLYGASGLLIDSELGTSDISYISDKDPFVSSYREYTGASFKNPITYRIDTNISKLHTLQRNLYLLIQVPMSNNSSLVVLEGDYTDNGVNTIKTNEEDTIVPVVNKNLSLLFANCGKTFAFSDRLVEYLLGNVITPMDDIPQNIYKVQRAVRAIDATYDETSNVVGMDAGYWDYRLTQSIDLITSGLSRKHSKGNPSNETDCTYTKNTFPFTFDVDSNVNKDMERFFLDRLGDY